MRQQPTQEAEEKGQKVNRTKTFVIGAMQAEIARVERQTWTGLPDKVCNPTTQRKLKQKHEDSSFKQAEECRARYLATARRRLAHYEETGEIW